MNFNFNLKILVTALVIIMSTSCGDDFLDRQPLDRIVSSNFYKTEADAQQALVAIYDALQYQSSPGVSWAPMCTVLDILSDDSLAGGADANDGLEQQQLNTYNSPTTNNIVHSIWLKNYTGIYRANLYLEVIGDIEASDEFKARTIAEAKFMRAYFYLELVRCFENIPLLTATIKGPSEYGQDQNDPNEIYSQIFQDLQDAAKDLPETLASNEIGRINKWAAKGLLARAYLFHKGVYGSGISTSEGNVNDAVVLQELEDVISNGGFSLLENFSDNFRLAGEFGAESVFEISHGDSPAWWDWGYLRGGEGNLAAQMQGPRVTGSNNFNRGWSFAPVTEKLYQLLKDDGRLEGTIINETQLDGNLVTGYQHTGYYSRKYTSDAEHWGSDGQFEHNRTCNYRILRYSDILLMAAELGSPNGQMYLDMVRARAGMPSIALNEDNLFEERHREFALEGIRYFDVLRRGDSYANTELTSNNERGQFYLGDQQLFEHSYDPSKRGFLPIPQTEIDLSNGRFKQNDGY